ncbi:MAG: DoxX family protein [Bacteroidales bacterium]|nr:DoxX family protein [Bacteroidales bacterium]
MKTLKIVARILLGLVFTFSGFVKAVDLVGSAIKFGDYFNAMGLPKLGAYSLFFAFLLSGLEFLVGFALLFKLKARLASWGALAFMLIFTPLTLWIALKNPVSDCGCFGDAVKLTNWETFWKNIVLLIFAVILLIKPTDTETKSNTKKVYYLLGAAVLFIFVFQWYNYNHLPVIDFRPYSVGTHIPDKMTVPDNAPQDSTVTYLYYEKDGVVKEFTMDNYPWDDSTWVWKDTKTIVIRHGYMPPIHDLEIYKFEFNSLNGKSDHNILDQLLADTSYSLLLISYDLKTVPLKPLQNLTDLMNYAQVHKYKTYFVTSSNGTDILKVHSKLPFIINFYLADATTLKTIIRSNPGLVLLKNGTIIAKWHYNDFPDIKEFEEIINEQLK